MATNEKIYSWNNAHKGRVNMILLDESRNVFYSCSDDQTVKIWNLK